MKNAPISSATNSKSLAAPGLENKITTNSLSSEEIDALKKRTKEKIEFLKNKYPNLKVISTW
jgi:hypothetical protein